ncbi:amino acid adenylation domain-containing protein [Thermoactinomyces sp. DSM 45891]|uniref:non-ribosomal peptide synthetase n=1 Tax=Thermoactinomyces sp. DSM 45891 TaxID=1761907 RepID=UPI00091C5792|nr:non-ribosomal peptide synthetase [Thermoactinomyces sp. DSM 45891]SFX17646.1 amino acid adenylation domain-containing protein [Thermoactinomyces sp. DSM 45891]
MIVYDKEMLERKQYWLDTFKREPAFPCVPSDFQETDQVPKRASLPLSVDSDVTTSLLRICKGSDLLMYTFLLAVTKIWLYKYSGRKEIGVGVPSHCPTRKLVPVVSRLEPAQSAKQVILETKRSLTEAYQNQEFPIAPLLEELGVGMNDRLPWLTLIVSLDNIHDPDFIEAEAPDLALMFTKEDGMLSARWLYNPSLYMESSLEQYFGHYTQALRSVLADSSIPVQQIDLLTEIEKKQWIVDCNDTGVDYERNATLSELFERQVRLHPEAIAIEDEGRQMTYRELNEAANQWARVIRNKGVCANQPVGIMLQRTTEFIIAILAVTKAGGMYVPLSTDYPAERIHYMLEDSGCLIALTTKNLLSEIAFAGEWVCLDDEGANQENKENLPLQNGANDLAYMIYTSGSTGAPKGVMTEHRSVHNLVIGHEKLYRGQINSHDRFLVCTNISFDASVFETWLPLLVGATLVMYAGEKFDVMRLAASMVQKETTFAFIPPALLNPLYDEFRGSGRKFPLTKMFVGGEASKAENLENYKALKPELMLVNAYGPTETTVICTGYHYQSKGFTDPSVPIGKPMANTQMYVLNADMQPVSKGVYGELWVGGDGIARGYWNQPELTAESFVENPFRPGTKMYRTGDIVKWLPDGNLQFIGRADHQVKIRGYRIELGEIENRLTHHEAVQNALVVIKEDAQSEKYLCAYVEMSSETTNEDLVEWIAKRLPIYMIPSAFVRVSTFPLTPNGKIDRRALPEPNQSLTTIHDKQVYLAPRNELEQTMVQLWGEVLQVESIGVLDNFFAMGGHSLKALNLVNKVSKTFERSLPLSVLFKNPTVASLCEVLQSHDDDASGNLILLSEGDEAVPPLFVVHGQGGGIINFVHLAQEFESKRTIYAFQALGYDDREPIELSVEQMAERYIAEIRQIAPTGPYHLMGWSFGGILVYEITKQLEEQGETVAYLGICDVKPRSKEELPKWDEKRDPLIRYALLQGMEESCLAKRSEEEQLQVCQKLIGDEVSDGVLEEEVSLSKLRIIAINGLALRKYQPIGVIRADIHLFLALEDSLLQDARPEEIVDLWSGLTEGQVKSSLTGGDHYSMLEPPYIKPLVDMICGQLEKQDGVGKKLFMSRDIGTD